MRKFKCDECGHTWELPYGEGGRGIDLTCPQCGKKNIHRLANEHGFGWGRGQRGARNAGGRGRGWRFWRGNRAEPQSEG